MTRTSLTQLYGRYAGQSVPLSSADADLMRFSRELEPASAQLSADLAAAFAASGSATHRRASAPRRAVAASRRWRGIAALAASLIVAVAVWSTHRVGIVGDAATAQNSPAMIAPTSNRATDRIFAAFDDHAMASRATPAGDEIFRDKFVPDEIFNSKSHDG
jgi:hypothetical protein